MRIALACLQKWLNLFLLTMGCIGLAGCDWIKFGTSTNLKEHYEEAGVDITFQMNWDSSLTELIKVDDHSWIGEVEAKLESPVLSGAQIYRTSDWKAVYVYLIKGIYRIDLPSRKVDVICDVQEIPEIHYLGEFRLRNDKTTKSVGTIEFSEQEPTTRYHSTYCN